MAGEQTEKTFEVNDKKQMLVLVRYKPAGMMQADDMLGGVASKVQGVADKIESAANSIPGLSVFFKEEKEPEKKSDKEYNYFKDYKDWDKYFDKMKEELTSRLNSDNEVFVFDFDADDAEGIKKEGKKLFTQIKSKIAAWKDYTACFHFVGLGQGGNVANEAVNELIKEEDFTKKWWVQSLFYVGTPLFANQHVFDKEKAFKGKGKIHAFANSFDLTENAISYFEPNDGLLKLIANANSNPISIFTGKVKAQLVITLGRLLTIKSFGTGSDNEGNIKKLTDCKSDVEQLVKDLVEVIQGFLEPLPNFFNFKDELPEFGKLTDGFDQIPGKCVKRLEKMIDELKNLREGTSLDTSRLGINKIFNVFCPILDQLTTMLAIIKPGTASSDKLMDSLFEKSGVKKILKPAEASSKVLPIDPYIEKMVEMAQEAEKKEKEAEENKTENGPKSVAKIQYDQSIVMISNCKSKLKKATKNGDVTISDNSPNNKEAKALVAEVMMSMLLPMMPNKQKFYEEAIQYLPFEPGGFFSKITAGAAFSKLQNLMPNWSIFQFDRGTKEEPGLLMSIENFDKEFSRIKGYLNKNNYPVHKDANSLYFIYNSHNLILKKPYGEILNTIDKETGYLEVMESNGYTNFYNLEKNEYQGGSGQKDGVQPVQAKEEEKV